MLDIVKKNNSLFLWFSFIILTNFHLGFDRVNNVQPVAKMLDTKKEGKTKTSNCVNNIAEYLCQVMEFDFYNLVFLI